MTTINHALKDYLTTRRSVVNMDLVAPKPDAATLQQILSLASRTPDHGKLVPWRFITFTSQGQEKFKTAIEEAAKTYYTSPDPEAVEKLCGKFMREDVAIVSLVQSLKESARIPELEQQMACGATGMNLIHASAAYGFKAHWITSWLAFHDHIKKTLGLTDKEQIAGFFFIGSSEASPSDRARPNIEEISTLF